MKQHNYIVFLFAIALIGCTKKNYLSRFTTHESQALIEFSDANRKKWKLHSFGDDSTRFYTLVSKGKIRSACLSQFYNGDTVFLSKFTDTNFVRPVPGLLDKTFLKGLRNADSAYTSWVDQNVVLGSGRPAYRLDVTATPGGLGRVNVGARDGQIFITTLFKCSCTDGGFNCGLKPRDVRECINRRCDFYKCALNNIFTFHTACSQQAADARAACALAAGQL